MSAATSIRSLEPVPRKRQPTRDELQDFHQAIIDIVEEVRPATVRGVFYQAEVRGIIEKTEQDCRRVQHALDVLRESGRVDWDDIVDGTRIYMKPDSWADPIEALEDAARSYRKNLWADADVIPEIWIEKDALSGTVYPVTAEWDVRLFPARGFSSKTFLHNAARDFVVRAKRGQSTVPMRPMKKAKTRAVATRNARFSAEHGERCVELDAIHPGKLRRIVRDAIEQHLPADRLAVLRTIEEGEREDLRDILDSFRGSP